MYEVEAKVPISKSEYACLELYFKRKAKSLGSFEKKDVYYNNPKTAFIRRRDIGKKAFFNLKNKVIKQGIETNTEMEWKIKDSSKFQKLLKLLGLKANIRKRKITSAYSLNNFTVELNYVEGLGNYLEIERVVKSEKDIPEAKKELIALFKDLGYSPKQFEKRYYIDLLADKRK